MCASISSSKSKPKGSRSRRSPATRSSCGGPISISPATSRRRRRRALSSTTQAPDKREQLLTKLQAAPRFAERLADALNVMLMERRGEDAAWRKYLQDSCKAGKPWDVMAKEMIAPDYANPELKGAGYFTVRRLEKVGQQTTDYPGLTRDAGRMFLGVDLQCCQCHNHLTVKSYKQVDFNGLFVAFQNIKLEGAEGKAAKVREAPLMAKYDFVSVLTKVAGQTGPRIPFGEEIEIPDPKSDDFWEVKPDPKKREVGVAKFSPLKEIAQRIATKENPWFVKNIANRMWWLLMGRGIVEPLDLHNPGNPPSHPELLDLLAQEMAAHDLSLQWLLKELSLTKTYQRTSVLAGGEGAAGKPLHRRQGAPALLRAIGPRFPARHGRVRRRPRPPTRRRATRWRISTRRFAARLPMRRRSPS